MPVQKHCEHCNKSFHVVKAREQTARFCSKACLNLSNRTLERRVLTCMACRKKFEAKQDHGKWPKFCSRECFNADALKPKEKECDSCGSIFVATKCSHGTEDGYRKYCSNKCRAEGLKRGNEYDCISCGVKFWLNPSKLKQRGDARCCSKECRDSFYVGVHSPAFKTGQYVDSASKNKRILMDRPGYKDQYMCEHRLVASKVIGRLVTRNEFVIRVNGNKEDNRPENLFICSSNSEYSRRRNGSLPWPTQSNLMQFASQSKT